MRRGTLIVAGALLSAVAAHAWMPFLNQSEPTTIDGVTFATRKGTTYVPLRETASLLGWTVGWDDATRKVSLNGTDLDSDWEFLFDGTRLVPVGDLTPFGATLDRNEDGSVTLHVGGRSVQVVLGEKRVEVSIKDQKLRAWQGERLVMETNISSGKRGHSTPQGNFQAGPYKARIHYSSIYDNAAMPWSVQVNGNVFIHGYRSVPRYPASHGCIRMPLNGRNAAKWFWHWVDVGTPVDILAEFSETVAHAASD